MKFRFLFVFLFFGLFFLPMVFADGGGTINFKIDSYSPDGNVTEDYVNLEVITNQNATCSYSLNSGLNYSFLDSEQGFNHQAILDIPEEKEYFVNVTCQNSNNQSLNRSKNFKFRKYIPLVISELFPKDYISTESPIISFRTNKNAICKQYLGTKNWEGMNGMDLTGGTNHNRRLEGLDTKSYTYNIECHDLYGQVSTSEIEFKIDKENPSVSLHDPKGTIDYNETINFTYTPRDDYGLSYCEIYINMSAEWRVKGYDSNIRNNKVSSFLIKNLNLPPEPHYWKIKCADKAGNSIESGKISFRVREVQNSVGSSWEASSSGSIGSESNNDNLTINEESESLEEITKNFEEANNAGGFITGAAISDLGNNIKNFFSPFIFIITILGIFSIVLVHNRTKSKDAAKFTVPVVMKNLLHKIFISKKIKQDLIKIPAEKGLSYENRSQKIRLKEGVAETLKNAGWRKITDKDNLVEHFNLRILMTREKKHISRERFAKIIGESETRIKFVEEGFLPHDYEHLIFKIEHYLKINLRK